MQDLAPRLATDNRLTSDIVFLSEGFRQATKYLYLALQAMDEFRGRVTFVSFHGQTVHELNAAGIRAFLWTDAPGHQHTWYALSQAKVVFCDSTLFHWPATAHLRTIIAKAIVFQLWHGVPAKDIGMQLTLRSEDIRHFVGWCEDLRTYRYVLCPHPTLLSSYQQFFPDSIPMLLPDPRKWAFSSGIPEEMRLVAVDSKVANLAARKSERVALWAPTITLGGSP